MNQINIKDIKGNIVGTATVSPEDYEWALNLKWHVKSDKRSNGTYRSYARTTVNGKEQSMHRLIYERMTGEPPDKSVIIDHIDGNPLNNQRNNIHQVTTAQNCQNHHHNGKEWYGIYFDKFTNKWRAKSGNQSLGSHDTPDAAAKAYDLYVLKTFGQHAKTNGLATYDEATQSSIENIIAKKKDDRALPKYIYLRDNGTYFVEICYKKTTKRKTTRTLEEAEVFKAKFLQEIEDDKKQASELVEPKEIVRDTDGNAIIIIKNNIGEVIQNVIVDDDKWHEMSKMSWSKGGSSFQSFIGGKMQTMRNYLFPNLTSDDLVRHVNNNKNDFRMSNMVTSSATEISHNSKKKENASSIYRGVTKTENRWTSNIKINHQVRYIGSFPEEVMAAIAYNIVAKEEYGDAANFNNVSPQDLQLYEQRVRNIMKEGPEGRTSAFIGVSFKAGEKGRKKWKAAFQKNNVKWEKLYLTELEAAHAYNLKIIEENPEVSRNILKLNKFTDEEQANIPSDVSIATGTKVSKYKGVTQKKGQGTWYVNIRVNGKTEYIGSNPNHKEAARMYNRAIKERIPDSPEAAFNIISDDE